MATKYKGGFSTLAELDRHRRLCLGLPVPLHKSLRLPWGYYIDPEDPKRIIANDDQLRLLLKVKDYLRQYSYEEMAAWLSAAGFPITAMGLHMVIRERLPFDEILLPLEEREKL